MRGPGSWWPFTTQRCEFTRRLKRKLWSADERRERNRGRSAAVRASAVAALMPRSSLLPRSAIPLSAPPWRAPPRVLSSRFPLRMLHKHADSDSDSSDDDSDTDGQATHHGRGPSSRSLTMPRLQRASRRRRCRHSSSTRMGTGPGMPPSCAHCALLAPSPPLLLFRAPPRWCTNSRHPSNSLPSTPRAQGLRTLTVVPRSISWMAWTRAKGVEVNSNVKRPWQASRPSSCNSRPPPPTGPTHPVTSRRSATDQHTGSTAAARRTKREWQREMR